MSYRIIIDSCGELTQRLKEDSHFTNISLHMIVDNELFVDDESFNQLYFLEKVKNSPDSPKSSCPSPEQYRKEYENDAQNIYVVTLSSPLSGSYNSAVLGKNLYFEEFGEKNIYVFDSRSASIGQTLIGMKIQEFEKLGLAFHEIINKVEEYIEQIHTFFVLETLETLRKNGRLSNMKAFAADILNIKLIMSATKEGNIYLLEKARGMNKALEKMVNNMLEKTKDCESKVLGISHCNCLKRAEYVRNMIMQKAKFREIFIVDTGGISSMYAGDGGIIMVV